MRLIPAALVADGEELDLTHPPCKFSLYTTLHRATLAFVRRHVVWLNQHAVCALSASFFVMLSCAAIVALSGNAKLGVYPYAPIGSGVREHDIAAALLTSATGDAIPPNHFTFMYRPKEGLSLFEPATLREICQLENQVVGGEDFKKFCLHDRAAAGNCAPPHTISQFFYGNTSQSAWVPPACELLSCTTIQGRVAMLRALNTLAPAAGVYANASGSFALSLVSTRTGTIHRKTYWAPLLDRLVEYLAIDRFDDVPTLPTSGTRVVFFGGEMISVLVKRTAVSHDASKSSMIVVVCVFLHISYYTRSLFAGACGSLLLLLCLPFALFVHRCLLGLPPPNELSLFTIIIVIGLARLA